MSKRAHGAGATRKPVLRKGRAPCDDGGCSLGRFSNLEHPILRSEYNDVRSRFSEVCENVLRYEIEPLLMVFMPDTPGMRYVARRAWDVATALADTGGRVPMITLGDNAPCAEYAFIPTHGFRDTVCAIAGRGVFELDFSGQIVSNARAPCPAQKIPAQIMTCADKDVAYTVHAISYNDHACTTRIHASGEARRIRHRVGYWVALVDDKSLVVCGLPHPDTTQHAYVVVGTRVRDVVIPFDRTLLRGSYTLIQSVVVDAARGEAMFLRLCGGGGYVVVVTDMTFERALFQARIGTVGYCTGTPIVDMSRGPRGIIAWIGGAYNFFDKKWVLHVLDRASGVIRTADIACPGDEAQYNPISHAVVDECGRLCIFTRDAMFVVEAMPTELRAPSRFERRDSARY